MIPTDIARDPTGSRSDDRTAERDAWTVIYDAHCGFCCWSLAQLLRADRDRQLEPVALGSAMADALLADMSPEERAASWHLVSPDGRRWSAGVAAVPLLRRLPGGNVPAAILETMPALTNRVYCWVADHRSLFSRMIPRASKQRADDRIALHRAR